MKLAVEYLDQTKTNTDGRELVSHLEGIGRRLPPSDRLDNLEVELVLMPESHMTELNRQFRRLNQAPDVLSFPTNSNRMLGSIVVNPVLAKNYAKQSNTDSISELKILAGHGLLHLLGFNHR